MNWSIWGEIETLLLHNNVRPILAVIPDNQDQKLMVEPAVPDFWNRVRNWQERGWAIALHGYQHIYINNNRGVLGLTPQSEFAGLPRAVQEEKLRRAIEIFKKENIHPDCWVAPSHSFDMTTVELLAESGVRVISDGLWQWPYTDRNSITWVPQQMWKGLRPMPPGVWTVCGHHNAWTRDDLERFGSHLRNFSSSIICLDKAVAMGKKRKLTLYNRYRAWCDLAFNHRAKSLLGRMAPKWRMIRIRSNRNLLH